MEHQTIGVGPILNLEQISARDLRRGNVVYGTNSQLIGTVKRLRIQSKGVTFTVKGGPEYRLSEMDTLFREVI